MAGPTIATLELSDFASRVPAARARFAAAFRDGLEEFGFVSITGHAVRPEWIRETYAAFERFFALPDAEKRAFGSSPGGARGYTALGVEHARDHAVGDLKEFFHVGRELPAGHALADVYPRNRWPARSARLRSSALRLYGALDACAALLLEALELAYGLAPATLSAMLRDGNSVLRALHYPPLAPGSSGDALRAAPHEDINLITLLCEASDAGLEIRTREGEWMSVAAPPGHIVVDAGDMLTRCTGGVIPATTHRVANPPVAVSTSRYSLPFFAHPRPEQDLSVLPRFATPERVAAHPPITAGVYLDERLREIGLQ